MNARLITALVAIFFACNAVGAASVPNVRSAAWSVTFAGDGQFMHKVEMSMAPACPNPITELGQSTFDWSFNWSHVIIGPNPVVGTPTGQLVGNSHQQYNAGQTAAAPPCDQKPCDQSTAFSADTGDQADPMTVLNIERLGNGKTYALSVAYDNSPSGFPVCHNMDPAGFPWYVPWSEEGANDTNKAFGIYGVVNVTLAQLVARKPITLSLHSGGTGAIDCSDSSLGITCSRLQSWTGTVKLKPLN